MRLVFFLLLLANIVFFAWGEGMFGARNDGRESGRLARQIQPERLTLAAPGEEPPPICRQLPGLARAEAERWAAELRNAGLSATAAPAPAPGHPGYWVRMLSQPNRAAADRKIAELKQLGVSEFQLLPEGTGGGYVISLGWFGSEAAANEYLSALSKRGVKSARVEPRERASDKFVLTVQGPEDSVQQRLAAIGGGQATTEECRPATP